MDFQLSEEQLLIRQSIREYAAENAQNRNSEEVVRNLAELDFLGIFYPEQYGGAGADFMSFVLCLEEMAQTSASAALIYASHCCLGAHPLAQWGTEEQKQQYLTKLCQGKRIGSWAYGEGSLGSDWLTINTTAEKNEGGYLLNGRKTYVVNAKEENLFIVFAKTAGEQMSAFIVEGESAGFSLGPAHPKMGLEGVTMADLILKDVRVPAASLLGRPGQGMEIYRETLSLQQIALAALALGIARSALARSISYGKERIQFGRPIIRFEALQVMVAKMAANIAAAGLQVYQAAGLPTRQGDLALEAGIARYLAQLAGEQACLEAVQIHGGYGYSAELGVEQLYRDMKGITLLDLPEKPLLLTIAQKITA
ncbi:acyl-CoA dehydrogenase family protein [Desulfitobacterium chlororespirans]|uniref:Butyryl-CoA dehydrogenase n=1 Tax=Desulfitobacterium chlororespirans DSM 11544 TaxID=1121395 RepID=A0A1M7SXV7_9FIRM|nr:acyl-CoA dehydrogenase family protein [Desulfitobacterium chlororespirans]SHN63329.1 butyryl-CoA dehydrogenase [Desulfitobacterium chlororespirans DSM 11544]